VIRNPHTLLIDDGQLAKNAHKTQKSDWTGGAGGRGREEKERLTKMRVSRGTSFCVNRDRLYDSRPGWNLKIRPSGAAVAAAVVAAAPAAVVAAAAAAAVPTIRYKNVFCRQTQLDPLWRTLASPRRREMRFASLWLVASPLVLFHSEKILSGGSCRSAS